MRVLTAASSAWVSGCLFARAATRLLRLGVLSGAVILLALPARAADSEAEMLAAPTAAFNHAHEWYIYLALGLGVLNLILLYLLNRSTRSAAFDGEVSIGTDPHTGSSERTEKRMAKRKREIDELRHQVEELTMQLSAEAQKRPTMYQAQEIARKAVQEELARAALPGAPGAANPTSPSSDR